jgi:hypothetical protein
MNKFSLLIKENIDTKYQDKLSDDYKNLKRSLLQSIDKTIENDNIKNIKEFIDDIIDTKEVSKLLDLTEETDIINFYLKFQNDIDEICLNEKYFDKIPSENNIVGLNDFVIQGTKFIIINQLKNIKKELE